MIIFSRRIGAKICIGDDTTVTVLEVNGNSVKLGIVALPDSKITREELLFSKSSSEKITNYTDAANMRKVIYKD